jgi:hypothetical protein
MRGGSLVPTTTTLFGTYDKDGRSGSGEAGEQQRPVFQSPVCSGLGASESCEAGSRMLRNDGLPKNVSRFLGVEIRYGGQIGCVT